MQQHKAGCIITQQAARWLCRCNPASRIWLDDLE